MIPHRIKARLPSHPSFRPYIQPTILLEWCCMINHRPRVREPELWCLPLTIWFRVYCNFVNLLVFKKVIWDSEFFFLFILVLCILSLCKLFFVKYTPPLEDVTYLGPGDWWWVIGNILRCQTYIDPICSVYVKFPLLFNSTKLHFYVNLIS